MIQVGEIHDGDQSLFVKVAKFAFDFMKIAARQKVDVSHKELFDFDGLSLFTMIYATAAEDSDLTCRVACTTLSRKLSNRLTRHTVMRRLMKFAEWGFLTTNTLDWREQTDGKPVKESTRITVHENFRIIFTGNDNTSTLRREFISSLLCYGQFRETCGQEDKASYQGFSMLVPYGRPEIDKYKISDLVPGDSSLVEVERNSVENRRSENQKWVGYKDKFVEASAYIWMLGQREKGLGNEKGTDKIAAWSGSTKHMPLAQKRERSELTKIFESYGGGVAAVAWSYYCDCVPALDENKRIVFDRNFPHRQNVFADKRPSQFAKNIISILKDPSFVKLSTVEWNDDIKTLLSEFYGELLDVEPREGHHKDKIGYTLGDRHILPDQRK